MSVEIVPMSVEDTAIEGLKIITTKAITDERGTIREFFRLSAFAELGLPAPERWSQLNMTWTNYGAIRGLHGETMTKLVGLAAGSALGAYVDARAGSSSLGTIVTAELALGTQVLVPPGVCNGFQATSEPGCQYVYCFDQEWTPGMSGVSINPVDPKLAIPWPIAATGPEGAGRLSGKDRSAPTLAQVISR